MRASAPAMISSGAPAPVKCEVSPCASNPVRDALVVVDLQHDFLPGGALAVAGGEEVVVPIARATRLFSVVVATQDWHPPGHVSFASAHPPRQPHEVIELPQGRQELWSDHCVQGSRGAALHPGLPDAASEQLSLPLRFQACGIVDLHRVDAR